MAKAAHAWPARTMVRERNRDALLAACAELAVEHGYAGTSVDAVAARAGLTKGAVYSIFGSKAALFQAVLLPEWGFPLPSDIASDRAPLRQVVDAIARRCWRIATDPRARRVLLLELELYVDLATRPDEWASFEQTCRERMETLAGELVARGKLRGPAIEVAASLHGTMQGMSQLVALGVTDVGERAFVDAARAVVLP